MQKVLLNVNESHDIHTMKSLYNHLASSDLEAQVGIFLHPRMRDSKTEQRFFSDVPVLEYEQSIDLVVNDFSDLNCPCIGLNNLEIDRSILRSIIEPTSLEEKSDLREKYGMQTTQPSVVIDYDCAHLMVGHVNALIKALYQDAHIYVIGSKYLFQTYKIKDQFHAGEQKVHLVLRNKQRDYYAMADLALNSSHLTGWFGRGPLFNFMEATEGAPLLMAREYGMKIFGFHELVEAGVIKQFEIRRGREGKLKEGSHTEAYFKAQGECGEQFLNCEGDITTLDIIDYARGFLESFKGNEEHVNSRAEFIRQAQSTYHPIILSHIRHRLGQNGKPENANLVIAENEWSTRLQHPDTKWRELDEQRAYDPRYAQYANQGVNRDVFVSIPYIPFGGSTDKLIAAGQDILVPAFRQNIDVMGAYTRREEDAKAEQERKDREWKEMERETMRRGEKMRGGCFLTTACVEHQGLPDDCNELETLREFRDCILLTNEDGRVMVREYYDLAPEIVKRIKRDPLKEEVFARIFRTIQIITQMIKLGEHKMATNKYKELVRILQVKYYAG
ncbi:MAG: hypothetical protein KKG59_00200 [Nanoarchaeota archaeon]|nr:hypothetical protein [Nanoarchaeota archaeon]